MNQSLLTIENLRVSTKDCEILKGINLNIKPGEIHVVMGLNGSGKSTLSKALTGHPNYTVTEGKIIFQDERIDHLNPEERAQRGIFLAFQYPVEIPGVRNEEFLRVATNMRRKFLSLPPLDPIQFFATMQEKIDQFGLNDGFLARNVNEGFSGGEKKRNEIFQMVMLDPDLAILDEIDSGLDIDALKQISNTINIFLNKEKSLLIVTHYQRLLDYIKPNYIHVMHEGQIIKTGNASLAKELEQNGYEWLITEQKPAVLQ